MKVTKTISTKIELDVQEVDRLTEEYSKLHDQNFVKKDSKNGEPYPLIDELIYKLLT